MSNLFQKKKKKTPAESETKLNFLPLSHGRIKRSGERMSHEREGYVWNGGRKES